MSRARPIDVGPYEFSLHDARRTIAHAVDLLMDFPESTRAHQAPRLQQIAAIIGAADVARLDVVEAHAILHVVWQLLMSARDDRISVDNLPPTAVGRVTQLSRSGGGVPKPRVDSIAVAFDGVEGDVQKTRRHHGRPNQALCLWNIETIDTLRADGHPVFPGSTGENVTVAALPWADVTPGVRLQIGTVRCEVASYAVPCVQNARWFTDRRFARIHHQSGPFSRLYATVLEPGVVSTGDTVVLEPGS